MKREIKFRGKRIDNGEWVFGLLTKDIKGHFRIQFDAKCFSLVVDPSTIGQSVGIKDWNNTDIYEGDIIEDNGKNLSVICWDNTDAHFINVDMDEYIRGRYYEPAYISSNVWAESLIVGNIHDNPELLKL